MSIDKKSLALGLAIGGKWNLLGGQGDRSAFLPVTVHMARRLPACIELGAAAALQGTDFGVLTTVSNSATVYGVEHRAVSAGTLTESEAAVPGVAIHTL